MNKLDRAVLFATGKHASQQRKGSNQPYLYHPLEVLSLAALITDDEDILCAAMLHDTVEDTGTKIEEIKAEFGDRVAELVMSETEDKRGGINKADTWKIRKQETIDHVASMSSRGAKIICLCDKVSNLRSLHLLQYDKGDELWNLFNMKDPKMHYWYYNSLKAALSELKDYSVYKEFEFLIDTIFNDYID